MRNSGALLKWVRAAHPADLAYLRNTRTFDRARLRPPPWAGRPDR